MPRPVLVACLVARAIGTATATAAAAPYVDDVVLYQQALRVQVAESPAAEAPQEEVKLAGPKAALAMKLAVRRVDDLELPGFLLEGTAEKEMIGRKVKQCFHTLLDATQVSWLIDHHDLAQIERNFNRVAWKTLEPLLHGIQTAGPAFWLNFWAQSKHIFAQAVFHDKKALMKQIALENEDAEASGVVEEVLMRAKIAKGGHRHAASEAFAVVLGPCTIDYQGCVLSPNFPGNYSNRDTCVITVNVNKTGPLSVAHFSTERGNDVLIVNGVRYSGVNGPAAVQPSEDMVWFSDYMATGPGFKICPTPVVSVTDVDKVAEDRQTVLTLVSGNCTVDNQSCAMSPYYPQGYLNFESCVFNVSEGAQTPLHVEAFVTEEEFDVLIVNGRNYSGTDGPEGVVPEGQIFWITDFLISESGWKICPEKSEVAVVLEPNNSVFTVHSGSCQVFKDGCVASPGYPGSYSNSGVCTIGVNTSTAGPLRSEFFSTERGYDVLTVNGMRFSGAHAPDGITPYEDLVWVADTEATASGWKLCAAAPVVGGAAGAPQDIAGELTVVDGMCALSEPGCVSSPNYPQRYGNDESCTINVTEGNTLPLRIADFITEWQLDALTVNNKAYSGMEGPDGVVPNGQILWSSDASVRSRGWKLCLMQPPAEETTAAGTTTAVATAAGGTATTITITTTAMVQSAWDDLAYHTNVSSAMVLALLSLEQRVQLFDASAAHFRKALEALPSFVTEGSSAVAAQASYVNGSLGKTLGHWRNFIEGLEPSFSSISAAIVADSHNEAALRGALQVGEAGERFRKKVLWFANEMTYQHLYMKEHRPEVLPSALEALMVPIKLFRRHLNEFVEYAFAAFTDIPRYFMNQVEEPFRFIGSGRCLDSEGRQYDTLESEGCDTVFWCMSACRGIEKCRGFTMTYPSAAAADGCSRCELRVEEGFNQSYDFWKYTWTDGAASGPVIAAGAPPDGRSVSCFGRQPYDSSRWTPTMRRAIEEAQARQAAKYEATGELWSSVAFRLKGAFWKITSAIEEGARRAVAADVRRAGAR
mmetsp:Transcript_81859/g.226869  ORF Transcript_81859/g.226869 Transcript_81859/m.226869 type:complete len:1040 (+) Transcript_81859:105-3224(+)